MLWYKNNTSDIVVSTRIRLARNLDEYPFPNALHDKKAVINKIRQAVAAIPALSDNLEYVDISAFEPAKRQALAEEHLISFDMISGNDKAALISKDKTMSIMLMEEDHLRMQIILPGEALDKAWDDASRLDDALEENLNFAFDEEFGYLTACPTNTGTGMRASVMMHLPAVEATGNINRIISSASSLGIAVRGIYGEGSKAEGSMYQISNQITSGISEKDIIESLKNVVNQIKDMETEARSRLKKEKYDEISDRVYRSYGTLKYARKISSSEAKALISDVMLGQNMGIIENENKMNPLEAMVMTEPAMIMGSASMTADERDKKRAEVLRSIF